MLLLLPKVSWPAVFASRWMLRVMDCTTDSPSTVLLNPSNLWPCRSSDPRTPRPFLWLRVPVFSLNTTTTRDFLTNFLTHVCPKSVLFTNVVPAHLAYFLPQTYAATNLWVCLAEQSFWDPIFSLRGFLLPNERLEFITKHAAVFSVECTSSCVRHWLVENVEHCASQDCGNVITLSFDVIVFTSVSAVVYDSIRCVTTLQQISWMIFLVGCQHRNGSPWLLGLKNRNPCVFSMILRLQPVTVETIKSECWLAFFPSK